MKNSSASNSGAVIFTILFSAALLYTNGIVSPALATIGQAFPDKSAETVQLIYSIPKIMLFFCSLLSGVIASRLSIKKCMVLGCVFQALGTLPAWFGGFGFLLFSRVLFGIGYGLIFPMVSAAITDLFSGDKRAALMGASLLIAFFSRNLPLMYAAAALYVIIDSSEKFISRKGLAFFCYGSYPGF